MRPAEDAEQEVSKTHSPGSGRITPLAYNIKEAARILSISRSKCCALIASSQLPAKKIGARTSSGPTTSTPSSETFPRIRPRPPIKVVDDGEKATSSGSTSIARATDEDSRLTGPTEGADGPLR